MCLIFTFCFFLYINTIDIYVSNWLFNLTGFRTDKLEDITAKSPVISEAESGNIST